MDKIMEIYNWIVANKVTLVLLYTSTVTIASIIVKFTPTLKDDNFLKAVVKFIGKWIAIDAYGPDGEK